MERNREVKYKVFIPTAGIGSRLGELTQYTNKSLVKVGDKPAISYIIEKYPEDVEIVVALGHFGNHVRDFLEIAYPTRHFTFVEVDNYDKPGSSLIYSFLCARDKIDCPFIFHACDTLVEKSLIPEPDRNWLGGCRRLGKEYTSFDIHTILSKAGIDVQVKEVYDKGRDNYNFAFIGIAGVYDWKEFVDMAEKMCKEHPEDTQLSNIHVHQRLVYEGIKHECVDYPTWWDTGNKSDLVEVQKAHSSTITSLSKKDEAIFKVGDKIIKFFSDPKIVKQKVNRAQVLKGLVPSIQDNRDNFFSYKFIEGEVLSTIVAPELFDCFLSWCECNLWYEYNTSYEEFPKICKEFYFDKTESRIKQFLQQRNKEDKAEMIEGIVVPSALDLLQQTPVDLLCSSKPHQFHGDLILDNVVYTGTIPTFILMDWRQSFGGCEQYGDIYYDLAKINGSLIFNQELVNKDQFGVQFEVCNYKPENIKLKLHLTFQMRECFCIFVKFLLKMKYDIRKVELLTALMWLNMCPLHEGELGEFLYYFGRWNLYRCLRRSNIEK